MAKPRRTKNLTTLVALRLAPEDVEKLRILQAQLQRECDEERLGIQVSLSCTLRSLVRRAAAPTGG